MTIKKNDKIFLAGHNGMVGSAILNVLKKKGFKSVKTIDKKYLDLKNQKQVNEFFKKNKFKQVYLCAAKVGGIHANNVFPADFIIENLQIQTNVINAAFNNGIKNLIFLGSSCVYPIIKNRKISENDLLTAELEPTNEPYAIAKISGIKLCESYNRQYNTNFKAIMPCNLFGPGDNFHPKNSHVMAAIIRKVYLAKIKNKNKIFLWGNGKPRREFLHVDDLAKAAVLLGNLSRSKFSKIIKNKGCHINVGYGKDFSIKEISKLISKSFKYKGEIVFDKNKPNGVKRKLLNSEKFRNINSNKIDKFEVVLDKYLKEIWEKKKLF